MIPICDLDSKRPWTWPGTPFQSSELTEPQWLRYSEDPDAWVARMSLAERAVYSSSAMTGASDALRRAIAVRAVLIASAVPRVKPLSELARYASLEGASDLLGEMGAQTIEPIRRLETIALAAAIAADAPQAA